MRRGHLRGGSTTTATPHVKASQTKSSQAKPSQVNRPVTSLSPPPSPSSISKPRKSDSAPQKNYWNTSGKKRNNFLKKISLKCCGVWRPPPPLLCRRIQTASSNINNFIFKKKTEAKPASLLIDNLEIFITNWKTPCWNHFQLELNSRYKSKSLEAFPTKFEI